MVPYCSFAISGSSSASSIAFFYLFNNLAFWRFCFRLIDLRYSIASIFLRYDWDLEMSRFSGISGSSEKPRKLVMSDIIISVEYAD